MSSRVVAALVAATLILAASASSASAAHLYMAPGAPDGGNCQSAVNPCGGFSYVQFLADDSPGPDTVHLAAGDYTPDTRTLSAADVTWVGPQAGVPAPGRTGPEARILVPAAQTGFEVTAAGISFDGLMFQGVGDAANPSESGLTARTATSVANARFVNLFAGIRTAYSLTVSASDFDAETGLDLQSPVDAGARQVTGSTFRYAGPRPATGIRTMRGTLTATGNTFLNANNGIITALSTATITGNRFSPAMETGVQGVLGSVDASNNWWGCNEGPSDPDCAGATNVTVGTWLVLTGSVVPDSVAVGGEAEVRATLDVNSAGQDVGPMLAGTPIDFATDAGTLADTTPVIGADGIARTTLTAPSIVGTVSPSVSLDSATVPLSLDVTPALSATPNDADFGSVAVGGSSTPQAFTVTNETGDPVRIRNVSLQGANAADFALWGNDCRRTLAAGASCSISAALQPTSPGAKSAMVGFVLDGFEPFAIPLTGTATSTVALSIAPNSLDFGSVNVGDATARQSAVVTNTSGAPVTITSTPVAGDAGDYSVAAGACRTILAPGASCTITASFRPITVGNRTATVTVRATGHVAQTLSLTGDGIPEALDVTPDSINYGFVAPNSNTRRTITLKNNGAAGGPVSLGAITLGGEQASDYALFAGACAKRTLAVDQSCEISVNLRPTSPGLKQARITINVTGQRARTVDLAGSVRPS